MGMRADLSVIGLWGVYMIVSKYQYKGVPLNRLARSSAELRLWQNRINRGWSIEKAVTTPKGLKKEFKYYIGETPAALIASKNGISKQQFWDRLSRGVDVYNACTAPIRKTKKQIEWEKINDKIITEIRTSL